MAIQPNESNSGYGHEEACARVASRFGERWLRMYAGQKLRSDPIFPAAFELLRDSPQPLVDVGCGVGLLAFYLRERNFQAPISGIDRGGRKIERACRVARRRYRDLSFTEVDASDSIERSGNMALFDVLHYLSPNEQSRLLQRLAARVAPGGMLVIRDCPRDRNARFWLTRTAERFAQATRWNLRTPLHFPAREQILSAFNPAEFTARIEPLWGRTPFNNHLFVFRRRLDAAVPAGAGRSDNSGS